MLGRQLFVLAALFPCLVGDATAHVAARDQVRLYVFDYGTLHVTDPSRFQLNREELATLDLSVACYLIVHPKGTLLWDVGAVADSAWTSIGKPMRYQLVLADSQRREITVRIPLRQQLASIGYTPDHITYLALSHYHYDHTANANLFARSTWLVRPAEHDSMFAQHPPGVTLPSTYGALRHSRVTFIRTDDFDVFGDGRVIIRAAPGHTPGHQMLVVRLRQAGTIVLSGDLYHYPEELKFDRVPTFEFDSAKTRATRVAVRAFLQQSGAHLWIQHDLTANARLRKAPAYYQ